MKLCGSGDERELDVDPVGASVLSTTDQPEASRFAWPALLWLGEEDA